MNSENNRLKGKVGLGGFPMPDVDVEHPKFKIKFTVYKSGIKEVTSHKGLTSSTVYESGIREVTSLKGLTSFTLDELKEHIFYCYGIRLEDSDIAFFCKP